PGTRSLLQCRLQMCPEGTPEQFWKNGIIQPGVGPIPGGPTPGKLRLGQRPRRRAPKVTVTREEGSLCQKECYPMAVVLVNGLLVSERVKTSRGAGCEPLLAPPCGRTPGAPLGGGPGGKRAHTWVTLWAQT